MIIVSPGYIVWDQIPAVFEVVLGGLGKDWADRGGDGAKGRDRGATKMVDLSGVLFVWGEIKRREREVRGKL